MKRIVYLSLIGIVLAGIVHIMTILLIPSYAAKDAWAKLANVSQPWTFSTIVEPGKPNDLLPQIDPAFGVAVCRYDLEEAPLIVTAEGLLAFWSVAIFDRQGRNIYSFNDRTAIERKLSLLVVDAVQLAQLRKSQPEDLQKSVLVRSELKRGFVLIRAFMEDESLRQDVMEFLGDASCQKFETTEEADVEPSS